MVSNHSKTWYTKNWWAVRHNGSIVFYLFSYISTVQFHSIHYESKFILDSFIFWVFPARFLRRLAAIVNIFPRSHVSSCVLFGFNQVKFFKQLLLLLTFSHGPVISQQISWMRINVIQIPYLPSSPSHTEILAIL